MRTAREEAHDTVAAIGPRCLHPEHNTDCTRITERIEARDAEHATEFNAATAKLSDQLLDEAQARITHLNEAHASQLRVMREALERLQDWPVGESYTPALDMKMFARRALNQGKGTTT